MLVDDKEVSNFILRKHIEKHLDISVRIHEFCSAQEALEAVHRIEPNLIFLDLCIPNFEDGFGFLNNMKERKLPHQVVVLTSSINEEHHQQVQQYANVINYITKPISSEELLWSVNMVLPD